jgi:5-methylcytosine-specific restriction endonuclease McrA
MNNHKKPNAERVWKQLEDFLVPHLKLSVTDRAVYSHLLRHSRLEGKARLHFSISWLSRGACLSGGPVREAVRRLATNGALRLLERSRKGHLIEVRLPEEIRAAVPHRVGSRPAPRSASLGSLADALEETDFLQNRSLRQYIHARERGYCFYCLSRLNKRIQCLDHVVPRAQRGRNSYRNLVSACVECNSRKSETSAPDFLRWLYRQHRITAAELTARLRALNALAAGKLRPPIQALRKEATSIPASRRIARSVPSAMSPL